MVSFARDFNLGAPAALEQLARFAQRIMTNVGAADLLRRVRSLTRGTARNPPTDVEQAALAFVRESSNRAAVNLLVEIGKEGGVRTHRPAVLRACIKALQLSDGTEGLTFHDAAIRVREQNRLVGRPLPKRAVGSTLLLKGLEAEVAVVLNAGDLDARNLYVAMTRGSNALTVCSPSRIAAVGDPGLEETFAFLRLKRCRVVRLVEQVAHDRPQRSRSFRCSRT